MISELKSCISTFDTSVKELENIEKKLAERYELTGNVRQELINRAKSHNWGTWDEDNLIQNWHRAYANYRDWIKI